MMPMFKRREVYCLIPRKTNQKQNKTQKIFFMKGKEYKYNCVS